MLNDCMYKGFLTPCTSQYIYSIEYRMLNNQAKKHLTDVLLNSFSVFFNILRPRIISD